MNPLSSRAKKKFKQFLSVALTLTTTLVLSGLTMLVPVAPAANAALVEGSLIKTADAPEVYIINDKAHGSYLGWKRHIFNPEVFNMYGHLKWENIQIVSQAVLDSYETSDLYKSDTDPRVYSLEETGTSAVKHHVTDLATFDCKGYSWDQVFIVNEKEVNYYATGSAETCGTTTPTVGSGLSVSLASDTPAASTILSDTDSTGIYPQALIPFTAVNFAAGSDGDVKVTTVKFKRAGIANDSDLGNLYLYDGDTRLAEYTSFNNKVVTFTNTAGLFSVAKGTTKKITLKGDLAKVAGGVSPSLTIGFDLVSSSDVVTDGATVSGSFPVAGNKMTTARVADLGSLYFSSYTTYPTTIKADDTNKELWRFNLNASSQDMEVRRIKLTMIGTISQSDIQNLRLEVAGSQVGSTASIGSDNTVVFDLSSSPISVTAGQTKTVILRGDMMGGAGRVFKFTIQRSADVSVYDTNYNVFVTPAKDAATTAFSIIQPTSGNGTSVDAGTLTLGVAADSPTGNIADAATGLTLAKFSFYASGETVKVDNLTVGCTSTGNTLENVKLLLDGSQVGSTISSLACSSTSNVTFGNTFQIPAGATKYLSIVADTTHSSVGTGETIVASLSAGSANAQGQTTLTSISTTAQTGRTLTVQSGAATVTKNTAFGDKSSSNPTGTVNATGVKIASFVVTAGSGEAIDITQFGLKDDSTTELGDNFQNLMLKDSSGVQIGSTISSLNTTAGTYTFSPSSAIRVNAGQQYVVDVFADVKSTVADSGTLLSPVVVFDSVTATGVSTSADASYTTDVNLQAAYISANGNLTVTAGADTPIAQQLVMGSTDVALATFKLEADAAEDITISDITVSDNTSSAATGTIKNLKLYVDGVQVGQTVQLSGTDATTTYANATFSGLSLTIPQNSSKVLTVRGDVTSYNEGATSGSTHTFALLANKGSGSESITAKGASSGAAITGATLDYGTSPDVDQSGSQMTVYRTKLSIAYASDSPSGSAGPSASAIVMKVNVTNSSNIGSYSATVKNMNFANSSVGLGTSAAKALKVYKDNTGTTALATTNYPSGAQIGNSAITEGNFTDVEIAAGSTKLFIVTLDTSEAGANDTVTVGMDSSDVTWTDGITSSITSVDSLPLLSKTLTY